MGDEEGEATGPSILVIEDGTYSDYRVVGVFSTAANAERAAGIMGLDLDAVSEWPLDPGMGDLNQGRMPWHVSMTHAGEVTNCAPAKPYDWPELSAPMVCRLRQGADARGIRGEVWATGAEHAIKIVNEFRIQARAEGKI